MEAATARKENTGSNTDSDGKCHSSVKFGKVI